MTTLRRDCLLLTAAARRDVTRGELGGATAANWTVPYFSAEVITFNLFSHIFLDLTQDILLKVVLSVL